MQLIANKLNRRFYGYRSACISELITAFSMSDFRTHKKAATTERYYLDKENLSFVDTFFKIKIADSLPAVPSSSIYLK